VLATARVGRIALTEHALPVIIPVRYEVDENAMKFPAAPPTLERAAEAGHIVCFQTDSVDPDGSIRSVTVIGRLEIADTRAGSRQPGLADRARLSTATLTGSLYPLDQHGGPAALDAPTSDLRASDDKGVLAAGAGVGASRRSSS
jgi:hypothetical protein